jgi:hypothetical protein
LLFKKDCKLCTGTFHIRIVIQSFIGPSWQSI